MMLRNDPKCTQILRNAPKHEFRVQWGGLGAFVEKNPDMTSWQELSHQLHQFTLFCIEFHVVTKRSKCTRTLCNAPKHEFRVQWGGLGAFIEKNPDVISWQELLN